MKDPRYTELVCKKFCVFYSHGKEGLECGTYRYLRENLTPGELNRIVSSLSPDDPIDNKSVRKVACARCGFLEYGCDFVKRAGAHPCGGYHIAARLF